MNKKRKTHNSVFLSAFKFSLPVFFGCIAIGAAFGLLMDDAGYPWWLTLLMGVVMYVGAGQYIAVGFFTAGTGILEAALLQQHNVNKAVLRLRRLFAQLNRINDSERF